MLATIKPSSRCDALSLHGAVEGGPSALLQASGDRDSDGRAESSTGRPGLRVQSSCYAVWSRCLSKGFVFLCGGYHACVRVPVFLIQVNKEKFIWNQ